MKNSNWIKPSITLILSVDKTEKVGSACESLGDFEAGTEPCS
jgi:hypothetical protein